MTAKIKLNAASGGGSVSLKAPSTTTGNAAIDLQLPVADGSADTFLKTDGSGTLSFATVASKVLKVHAYEVSTALSITTNDWSQSFSANSVTPTKTGSKFIVIANYSQVNLGNGDMEIQRRCTDGTFTGGYRELRNYHTDKNVRTTQTDIWFMDGTYTAGSAVTFTIQAIRGGQSNNCSLGSGSSAYKSSVVIIEVDLT